MSEAGAAWRSAAGTWLPVSAATGHPVSAAWVRRECGVLRLRFGPIRSAARVHRAGPHFVRVTAIRGRRCSPALLPNRRPCDPATGGPHGWRSS